MNRFDELCDFAGERIEGTSANQWLWQARERLRDRCGRAEIYELVLNEETDWHHFVHDALVKLADHFEAKEFRPPGGDAFVAFVWRGACAYAYEGTSFWRAIAQMEGCTVQDLTERVENWRQLRQPTKLLPPPTSL